MANKKGPSGVGTFFIVLFVLIIVGVIAWVVFTQLRARRLGLPPPTLASYNPFKKTSTSRNYPAASSSGPVGWVKDKVEAFRNRRNRTADGAYEERLGPGSASHGQSSNNRATLGALDPDEAWDARVGNEADAYGPGGLYEQELDNRQSTAYQGQSTLPQYGHSEPSRGRSRSREPADMIGGSQRGLDQRYDEEMGRAPRHDPFGDTAEPSHLSMRGVSPRPMDDTGRRSRDPSRPRYGPGDTPPEHKSVFRENV
ncbi:MAG: hypothetical protein M1814_000072 [Vezdaea aestivalis]|nr:MAG: hypothetical protein M1814_000072 [Vezdaea aestivalis]